MIYIRGTERRNMSRNNICSKFLACYLTLLMTFLPAFSYTSNAFAQSGTGSISILPTGGSVTDTFRVRDVHPVSGRTNVPHNGMDFGSDAGTVINATHGGTVTFSGSMSGYGNTMIVTHTNPNGLSYQTLYAHNASNGLSAGSTVTAGQQIAVMGNTGGSTGTHLHYEIRVEDPNNPGNFIAINPESAEV